MTTYMNIDAKNRRVEIGSTWYAKSALADEALKQAQARALEQRAGLLEQIVDLLDAGGLGGLEDAVESHIRPLQSIASTAIIGPPLPSRP